MYPYNSDTGYRDVIGYWPWKFLIMMSNTKTNIFYMASVYHMSFSIGNQLTIRIIYDIVILFQEEDLAYMYMYIHIHIHVRYNSMYDTSCEHNNGHLTLAWVNNYTHCFLFCVIIHHNHNLASSPLKLKCGWAITRSFMCCNYMPLQ